MKDMFYKALARLVEEETERENVEVTSMEQETRDMGACETCSYTEVVIEIYYTYKAAGGDEKTAILTYYDDFSSLLNRLDAMSKDEEDKVDF